MGGVTGRPGGQQRPWPDDKCGKEMARVTMGHHLEKREGERGRG